MQRDPQRGRMIFLNINIIVISYYIHYIQYIQVRRSSSMNIYLGNLRFIHLHTLSQSGNSSQIGTSQSRDCYTRCRKIHEPPPIPQLALRSPCCLGGARTPTPGPPSATAAHAFGAGGLSAILRRLSGTVF